MKKFIIVFLMFLGVKTLLRGQQENKILPPTPTSAQLLKYTETPVSLANGIPEIKIPLFNIESGEIIVPIELRYHAGGIKVEEISSEIGIGWTLRTGGRIIRVMRDKPDDILRIGFMYNTSITEQDNPFSYISDMNMDVEADLFYFDFLEYSGSFAFDKEKGKFIQFPLSDLEITPILEKGEIKSFVIIDEKGVEYYFGMNKDRTNIAIDTYNGEYVYKVGGSLPIKIVDNFFPISYTNTWHLTEIISKGNRVKFSYDSPLPTEQLIRAYQHISYSDTNPEYSSYSPVTTYQIINGSESYIKKITSDNGYIEFEYSKKEREDYKGGKILTSIKKKAKDSDDYLSFVLNQGYMVSSSRNNAFENNYGLYYTKRLRLDKLSIINKKSDIMYNEGSYIFTYSKINLPNRFSYAQDYWGYYNGEIYNKSLVTSHNFGANIVEPSSGKSKRNVNPNYSSAGILTKIQYPTGGSVEYEYESNLVSNYFGTNIQDYSKEKKVVFSKNTATKDSFLGNYEKMITINNALWNNGRIYISSHITGCGKILSMECSFLVRIEGVDNSYRANISTKEGYIYLPNGTYRLIAEDINAKDVNDEFFVSFIWDERVNDLSEIYVGGIRVKSIILDDLSGKVIEKKYKYDSDSYIKEKLQYETSGKLATFPNIRSETFYGGHMIHNIGSRLNYPSINIGKGLVQYQKVTEIIGNKLKSEYYFDYVGDIESPIVKSGYQCANEGENDYFKNQKDSYFTDRRGKLLERKDFKLDDNGVFSLVRKETNTYSEDRAYVIKNFSTKYDIGINKGGCLPIRYNVFSQRTNFFYLSKKVLEEYLNSNLTTQIVYSYANPNHYQLTEKLINNFDGSIEKKIYSYAHDKSNQYLIDNNIVGVPLETTTSLNGKIISKTETKYPTSKQEANNKTQGLPLPISVVSYDLENMNTPIENISYTQYDNKGNLLEYRINGITPTTIIWGYNQTLPIAKIEGATYEQVKNLVSDIILKSNQDKDEQSEKNLIKALDEFREKPELKKFHITTYTHNPLIGVTSITTPSGLREIYIYDSANRLKRVIDAKGNILKEFMYNYKGEKLPL